jgi:hypothetical protein
MIVFHPSDQTFIWSFSVEFVAWLQDSHARFLSIIHNEVFTAKLAKMRDRPSFAIIHMFNEQKTYP